MGEYIKHPSIEKEEEIKIGVCRGDKWETYLSKDILIHLKELGFKDWYAGKFTGGTETLDAFIERYDDLDTSYISFSDLVKIDVDEQSLSILKEELLSYNLALVLFRDNELFLVTDRNLIEKVIEIVDELGIKNIKIEEY